MAKPEYLIALEEHFLAPGVPLPERTNLTERAIAMLTDFSIRLDVMDKNGVAMQVLSHSFPPWRLKADPVEATKTARAVNDHITGMCAKYPGRFAAFATLPLQDPKAGADELERAVTQLGHKGALIHHMGTGDYLDHDRYSVLWERAVALDVPLYLHPAATEDPLPVAVGYNIMASAGWAWTAETGGHALRLVLGGVFDRYPTARLILGHMGETLPYLAWRIDSRFRRHVRAPTIKKLPSAYIRENMLMTTSGMFADAPLVCAVAEMGIDSILFSIDYPLEEDVEASEWIAKVPLPQAHIEKIAHGNIERVLKLKA